MRVLVAGGTGAIGRQLVPLLCEVGAEVTVMVRPSVTTDEIPTVRTARTVRAVRADAIDADAVRNAVEEAAPDVIVNLLTAIPHRLDPRHIARDMSLTNRLRVEGTAHLVAARGGARIVSEGVAYAYQPDGGPVADEERPLWRDGPRPYRASVAALLELERVTLGAGGTVLRLGHLYGPGTAFARDGAILQQLKARRLPQVGRGEAMFSFIHSHDVATAITAALDKEFTGPLNVVDDTPTCAHAWLPELARMIDAPPPRHVPVALARLAIGAWGVAYMNRIVGADNTRTRLVLDWRPRFPSWQDGFSPEVTSRPTLGGSR